MRSFSAFLRLIRWPNLVFIILTQFAFYYCIVRNIFDSYGLVPVLSPALFYGLVLASVCIAAAGYIINDYFDLHIDAINKPSKLVIDRTIKRRWAIAWHFILSSLGIIISIAVCYRLHSLYALLAAIVNLLSVGALWLYSTTYKKKLLIGNVLISLLTAWTLLILYLTSLHDRFLPASGSILKPGYSMAETRLFKFAMLYSGFAFVISLIREVVKDMEDTEGDFRYGCRTMPIAWGIPASKVFVAVWIIVLIAVLVIVQFYTVQLGWWWSAVYCLFLIILPLIWVLKGLHAAQVPKDYHRLSSFIKGIMLSGILSMLFFKYYI